VESAVIEVSKRPVAGLPNPDPEGFATLVRQGFSSRRKQLRSLLKLPPGVWEEWSASRGYPVTARAEDLSVDHWADLALHVTPEGHDHPHEMCDVVDSEDRVLESRLRTEVHVNNLLHRAVHLWIFNAKGELFLQKRSPWKLNHPDQWCSSAAGHVDSGETYEEAGHREMREEIGADCHLVKFWKTGATEETGFEFVEYLVGICDGPFRFAPGEVETGAFFPIEQIRRWVERSPQEFTPLFRMAAAKFLGETERLIDMACVS
jgi:16S rRNA (adenine1518-N6/adenine1519-N6)-dimethyltransferase